jgi:hypothetical protein
VGVDVSLDRGQAQRKQAPRILVLKAYNLRGETWIFDAQQQVLTFHDNFVVELKDRTGDITPYYVKVLERLGEEKLLGCGR